MRLFRGVVEAYDWCVTEGSVLAQQEFEEGRVMACLRIADEDLLSAQDAVAKKRWNSAYKLHYDVLHQLTEAFISFEKVKVKTHLCLFSYLCVKHPELEFNWDFFERVRTKRNGMSYYGTPITDADWKEVALQFMLYIKLLRAEIEKRRGVK